MKKLEELGISFSFWVLDSFLEKVLLFALLQPVATQFCMPEEPKVWWSRCASAYWDPTGPWGWYW